MHTRKKIIFTLLISLLITNLAFGQIGKAIPTLKQLQSWLKMSNTKVEAEAAKFGFQFWKKSIEDGINFYKYKRNIQNEDSDVLTFAINKNNYRFLEMILNEDFFDSFQTFLMTNYSYNGSCDTEENIGIEETICEQYEDENYNIILKAGKGLSNNKEDGKNRIYCAIKIITKTPNNN